MDGVKADFIGRCWLLIREATSCMNILAVEAPRSPSVYRNDQFGISVNRGPRPNIASTLLHLLKRDVLLLCINEMPRLRRTGCGARGDYGRANDGKPRTRIPCRATV